VFGQLIFLTTNYPNFRQHLCYQNDELRQVMFLKLGGTFTGTIKPRNPE
jgi:hypothetical protein